MKGKPETGQQFYSEINFQRNHLKTVVSKPDGRYIS